MKKFIAILLGLLPLLPALAQSGIHSFESQKELKEWKVDNGKISTSTAKYKLGSRSMRVDWKKGAELSITSEELQKASKSKNGGITLWIYNETPATDSLTFSFSGKDSQTHCSISFSLNYKGWRCLWAKFREDMGMKDKAQLSNMNIRFPEKENKGTIYIDNLEFNKNVSWQKMTDAQYKINRTDFALVHDLLGYRRTQPYADSLIEAQENDIRMIEERLTNWYLGDKKQKTGKWSSQREREEKAFIQKGLKDASVIEVAYDSKKCPVGAPIYPMCAPDKIEGETVMKFRYINEKMLIPLVLDYRKNKSMESLKKALYVYDWYNDQGWADGSAMGTLCFEKLRSSGYFHSFFLLKDQLTKEQYERELNAMNWFTLFGSCYHLHKHGGEVADNLRALALPKLIYALSIKDTKERAVALSAFKAYMDNAIAIAPGFYGTFKADFSGYHHRGPYNSAYYPHALYAASLVAYILHDTPYALSTESMNNLKQGLLTFRFFSAGLEIPAGTVGRFPMNQQILETILPAYAYVAFAGKTPDKELIAAFKKIVADDRVNAVNDYIGSVNSNLTYTASIGETQLMERAMESDIQAENAAEGSLFMPYSGLLVVKNKNYHFNTKGFSRYIWDYESSKTENLQGRYLAYGQVEYFDFTKNRKSYNPKQKDFQWNFIPGTTSKVISEEEMKGKAGRLTNHRCFSDETFLTGVHHEKNKAMFAFKMHDINYDTTFRANKSVFFMNDLILCVGSDIANNDTLNPTVTTLYQSFEKNLNEEGNSLFDGSFHYTVKEGDVIAEKKGNSNVAYLNHGTNPAGASYAYFMTKSDDEKRIKGLLSDFSAIEIEMQSKDAHIVSDKRDNSCYGALFNANREYETPVKRVNIPLSFVMTSNGSESILTICEPDMRRISRDHMNQLSEADVIDVEKPHTTEVILNGLFDLKNNTEKTKISQDKTKNETRLTIETIRGENYRIELVNK